MPSRSRELDERFMARALELAQLAAERGEVPVGAVVVKDGEILGEGFNQRECCNDPTGHAEIVALRQAAQRVSRWRVDGATLYVTLEPCPMCAGALVNARIKRLVYGASDLKGGAVRSLYALCDDPRLNHRLEIRRGVQQEACTKILQDFFSAARERIQSEKNEAENEARDKGEKQSENGN